MYVETVPNRKSPPAILLRESWREGRKTHKRTLANLSSWPLDRIEALKAALKGGSVIANLDSCFETVRTMAHGHVVAVLETIRALGIDRLVASKRCRERDLVMAMVAARIIAPGSKLALARGLGLEAQATSLGHELGLENATEDELYAAMDWLLERQEQVEKKLVARHLKDGSLVLYDVTSAHFEGRQCPLAAFGHPHGGPGGKLQINFGVLADEEGRPVAVEVFKGNVGDPTTFTAQVRKVREKFRLKEVIYVGDRGMITSARIREDLKTEEGIHWITALRTEQIRRLLVTGVFQPSVFDEVDLAEVMSPDYPGERLVVCRNLLLAEERRRKRGELLDATESKLEEIVQATQRERRPLRGKQRIALRVGKVIGRFKVAKHFKITVQENGLTFERDQARIDQEAALDGFYVVRTSLPIERMTANHVVATYKSLSRLEQAFRMMKSIDLKVRPIWHHLENRVRAHVLLCMLAYYLDWHLRKALAPLLFEEDDQPGADEARNSPVAKAQRSPSAQAKAATKRTPDGLPVQSLSSLLQHLATIALNEHRPTVEALGSQAFFKTTRPDPLNQKALELLGVRTLV